AGGRDRSVTEQQIFDSRFSIFDFRTSALRRCREWAGILDFGTTFCAEVRIERRDGNPPAGLAGRRAADRDIAPCGNQRILNAMALQYGQSRISRIALADAAEIQAHSFLGE